MTRMGRLAVLQFFKGLQGPSRARWDCWRQIVSLQEEARCRTKNTFAHRGGRSPNSAGGPGCKPAVAPLVSLEGQEASGIRPVQAVSRGSAKRRESTRMRLSLLNVAKTGSAANATEPKRSSYLGTQVIRGGLVSRTKHSSLLPQVRKGHTSRGRKQPWPTATLGPEVR
jgi:primosomal replication protein N